jgi:hypothetical protein
MKDESLKELVSRIHQELDEIRHVLLRINEGWERARRSNDDYYIDGVALNLHGFYAGFERIFVRIAEVIDGDLPQGEAWHLLLLQQMLDEVPNVRPAVISIEAGNMLNEYRGFRHIVRNVYTYKLDPAKVGKLVLSAQTTFTKLNAELLAFASFLEQGQ